MYVKVAASQTGELFRDTCASVVAFTDTRLESAGIAIVSRKRFDYNVNFTTAEGPRQFL